MGGAFNSRKMETNEPAMERVRNLEAWGQDLGIGRSGKLNKKLMNQMYEGDYSGLAGGLLSPLKTAHDTEARRRTRQGLMSGNAMYAGTQPALMRNIENEAAAEADTQYGNNLSNALPGLWGQVNTGYQNALGSQRGFQQGALQGAMQGSLQANQYRDKPGWLGQVTGAIGGIGGAMMGIPRLGGFGGGFNWNNQGLPPGGS